VLLRHHVSIVLAVPYPFHRREAHGVAEKMPLLRFKWVQRLGPLRVCL
jgi:hypothetical protein